LNPDEARRPRSVTLAVILLILGALMAAVAAMSDPQMPRTPTLMTVLVLACFWFAVRAGRGRRVARTTVTCLTAAILLFAAPFALADPLYGGPTLALACAFAVPGLVLLYGPAAERYVRARTGLAQADPPANEV
jgi:peptidoglycan/LPS O-acetylase OafA/YrhL